MEDEKRTTYRGYTEARARAYAKYIEQYKEVKVRMRPEQYEQIKAHAEAQGEKSVNAFIIRAVMEVIERESA